MSTLLDQSTFRDLCNGRCSDPFGALGPHSLANGFVIRSLQPGSKAVTVIDDVGNTLPMQRINDSDLFEVKLDELPASYELSIDDDKGNRRIKDPYAYPSAVGEIDLHLFAEGTHQQLYRVLGSHVTELNGTKGTHFGVWAPNAKSASVVGNFNHWDARVHTMRKHPSSGIWDLFIPDVGEQALYKYQLTDANGHALPLKNDPFAAYFEQPPGNASIVFNSQFIWSDDAYLKHRQTIEPTVSPVSIYEVHAGSWRLNDDGRLLSYRELANTLIPYVVETGFTHIELMPITEHPFTGSWGYQPIGLFAPTSRFGSPDDFRYFVDQCHAANIGVIMDWVPAHFPSDDHGLAKFDGTHLYEHADPKQGLHQDWDTLIYNYGRREVANYLFSNAIYWIKEFHLDGLRVDAVASMLYLDYSRDEGQWIPNEHGGRENLEAIAFLKRMNELVHAAGGMTLAEESTSFPGVSHRTDQNGLGFTFKWNMGWMHDTLDYFSKEPVHRKHHQNNLTFGLIYAFSENFLLPFSHDEVVYGKGSMLGKMPGDDWQRFANLRTCFAYMFTYPGKKLLFMGSELGQPTEWQHEGSVAWDLLDVSQHKQIQLLVKDLNHLYRNNPSLHEGDCRADGFDWIDCDDNEQSVICYYRRSKDQSSSCIVVCNFTPEPRHGYLIGVDDTGKYVEMLNTDAHCYGGSGLGQSEPVSALATPQHGKSHSIALTLPPLAVIVLKRQ